MSDGEEEDIFVLLDIPHFAETKTLRSVENFSIANLETQNPVLTLDNKFFFLGEWTSYPASGLTFGLSDAVSGSGVDDEAAMDVDVVVDENAAALADSSRVTMECTATKWIRFREIVPTRADVIGQIAEDANADVDADADVSIGEEDELSPIDVDDDEDSDAIDVDKDSESDGPFVPSSDEDEDVDVVMISDDESDSTTTVAGSPDAGSTPVIQRPSPDVVVIVSDDEDDVVMETSERPS